MRYVEMKDKNGKPIFEGDELILTIPDKDFGGSYLGKFCEFYKIDLIKIKVLENSNFLQAKYMMTFFKNDIQIVTNQENAYWNYYSDCQDDGKNLEKTLEDFSDIENAKDLKETIVTDSMFFSYIVGTGIEKVDGYNAEPKIEKNENLKIQTEYNEDVFVGDNILVKPDDKLKKLLDNSLTSSRLKIKEYTHLLFRFKRIENMFNFKIEVFLTNEKGDCQVFYTRLNQEGKKIKENFEEQEWKLEDAGENPVNKEKIKEIRAKIKELYNKEEYISLENHKILFGIGKEINMLNATVRNGLEMKKIN